MIGFVCIFGNTEISSSNTLDTVVVTAEKKDDTYQTGDVDLDQMPGFYTVIQREEFEGKIESLSEVIKKETGIQINQMGGLGSYSTVSLRGATGSQVMVYLDGVLLNDSSGGGVNLANISLADVESIEVYKGTTPAQFAKSSIGGVVNIKLLRPRSGIYGSVSVGYGSFGTEAYSALLNAKPGRWDCLLSADYLASDNDYSIENNNGTPLNPDDDRTEDQANAQFDQQNMLFRAGYDVDDASRITLMNQWFSKDQGLVSWNNKKENDSTFTTDRNITTAGIEVNDLSPLHLNTHTQVYYERKKEVYDDRGSNIGLGAQYNTYRTNKYGGTSFLEYLLLDSTLSLTFDYQREEYERDLSSYNTSEDDPGKSYRNMATFAVQDTLPLFDETLLIIPTIRFVSVQDRFKVSSDNPDTPIESDDRDEGYLTSQLGIKYQLFEPVVLKSNISKYVREPSFYELFGDRGYFIPNPELESENGLNYDIGVEVKKETPGIPVVDSFLCEGAFFGSDVKDRIVRVYDARGVGKSLNISKSTIHGLEGEIQVNLLSFVTLTGKGTIQQSTVKNDRYDHLDDVQLPGLFQKSYLAKVEFSFKGAKLYSEYIIEKDKFYDSANLLQAEDKYEMNSGLSCSYRAVTARFDVKNILDKQYEDYRGYALPGIHFNATIKVIF